MTIKEIIDKCLFVIGAGFSKKSGCKTSSEMLVDLKNLIQDKSNNIFNEIERETLNFLLSCLAYHCEWRSLQSNGKFKFYANIEELIFLMRRIRDREEFLPYPITGSWADKLVQLETSFKTNDKKNNISNLFSSIELKIKNELLKEWLKFSESNISYLMPLKKFFQSYPDQEFCMEIFSLNYDQIIENYFKETGIWSGFSNGKWVGLESSPEEKIERRRINLYKIHGSINWLRDIAGDIFEEEKFEINNFDIDGIQKPFIIFGQGIKTFSVEPFFSLIYHFRKLIKKRDYIFIIGYSFFDPYINNLLISETIGSNKKIIIVNKNFGPEEIQDKNVLNKYNKSKNKFGECQYKNYKEILADYIKEIQINSFYSELPEFNINYVKADSLFYINTDIESFIPKYFSNNGIILRKLIEQFEKERVKIEKPFN
ncbi:MAG: SIR2 family protein [Actinobacteria bacterium]|nr:SIR2 family protein [Actinomycetota bacterium]